MSTFIYTVLCIHLSTHFDGFESHASIEFFVRSSSRSSLSLAKDRRRLRLLPTESSTTSTQRPLLTGDSSAPCLHLFVPHRRRRLALTLPRPEQNLTAPVRSRLNRHRIRNVHGPPWTRWRQRMRFLAQHRRSLRPLPRVKMSRT